MTFSPGVIRTEITVDDTNSPQYLAPPDDAGDIWLSAVSTSAKANSVE